jgi:hypothetical protein
LESTEEFFRFDLVLWVSHISNATLLQQILRLDDHKLEVRLFLGGQAAPFRIADSGLTSLGVSCDMRNTSKDVQVLCSGLSLPAGAFSYDGDLPKFELGLYMDSLPIMRAGIW